MCWRNSQNSLLAKYKKGGDKWEIILYKKKKTAYVWKAESSSKLEAMIQLCINTDY